MVMSTREPAFIGIDIGTSSTKCAVFDATGTLLAEASEPLELQTRGDGWVEQRPADYLATTESALRAAVGTAGEAASRVAGIGVTGQMGGLIGLDSRGRP